MVLSLYFPKMHRKDKMQEFFSRNSTIDNTESFVAAYSSKYGTYTYDNIAAMVEKIYSDREDWIKGGNGNSTTYESKYPDWNKVILIPVTPVLDSRNSAISYRIDTKLHQAKLIGGDDGIKIKTIRSRF